MNVLRAIFEAILGLLIKCVIFGTLLFLVWLRHSLSMPPGSPSLQNQSYIGLAAAYVNAAIFWAWSDVLILSTWVFAQWHKIENQIIKLGILFVTLLLVSNFRTIIKEKVLIYKLSVYCPIDNLRSRPMSGTVDRYCCPKGHQFSGEAHNYYNI